MTSVPGVNNYSDRQPTSNLNKTSFDENGQFIGTSWNQTTYIKNDQNAGTVFEHDKDMTIQLNSRYNKGGAAIYANLDKKHTGISFDLLDKFIEAAKDGKLEDVDHQGYTRENMVAFGKAFDELQKQKKASNPYNRQYTNMKDKTTFTFTADELKTLYEAAGFTLKKAEEPKPVEPPKPPVVEPPKEEVVEPPKPPVVEPPKEEPKPEIQAEAHGNEKYSNIGLENTKQIILDGFKQAEAITDGDSVCLDFSGSLKPADNGNYYKKGKVTIKVSDNPEVNPHTLPDSEANKFRYKVDEDGNIYVKKTGLFNRIFSKYQQIGHTDYIPNKEANQELQDKAPARAQLKREGALPVAEAPKAEEKQETPLDAAIKKFEAGERVEVAGHAYYDEEGKMVVTNNAKLVRLSDGSYAFKDISYAGRQRDIYYAPIIKEAIGTKQPTLMTGEVLEGVKEAE